MALGSLNCGCAGGAALEAAAPEPTGDGVGGAALLAPAVAATGAGGGAGVAALEAWAGVDGTFEADAAAGAGFG